MATLYDALHGAHQSCTLGDGRRARPVPAVAQLLGATHRAGGVDGQESVRTDGPVELTCAQRDYAVQPSALCDTLLQRSKPSCDFPLRSPRLGCGFDAAFDVSSLNLAAP